MSVVLLLLAAAHVLHVDSISDDHRRAGAEPVRLLQLPLHGTPGLLHLGAVPLRAQQACEPVRLRNRLGLRERHVHAPLGLLLALGRKQDPLHARRPADAGRRRATELGDQPVVAPTAAEGALGTQPRGLELEQRARVVVEPAHERRVDLVGDARVVEQRAHGREVLGVLGAQALEQPRCPLHHRARTGMVGVEGAQRVGIEPPAHLLRELLGVGAQVGAQLVEVVRAGLGRAQRRDPQAQALACPGLLHQLRQQQDQLGVERGIVGAEGLGSELGELAVATGLRRLVTKERAPVEDLHRLRQLVHAVLDVGAADPGGVLGAQRQRAAGLVLEGEHLLLDDVGRLPHPAREQVGVLEHRRLDRLVAGAAEQLASELLQPSAPPRIWADHVQGAPRGLQLLGRHGAYRASSARNGLVARSAPSEVTPMWPG